MIKEKQREVDKMNQWKAQKKRRVSQRTGAWAGLVVITDGDIATKSVTKERLVKTRDKIRWLGMQAGLRDRFTPDKFPGVKDDVASKDERMIHFKTTERLIGFVV